jgi:hypothetical protein
LAVPVPLSIILHSIKSNFLQEKAVEVTKQKEETRRKPKPNNKEQEGMPPERQHCPPEKRRGDRNPECHEEHQKDVA